MRNVLRKLEEGYGSQLFDEDADLGDLLRFAKAYADMGSAVQEQLHDLVNWGGAPNRKRPAVNGNAVRMIKERMGRMHPFIGELCDAWMKAPDDEEEE